MADSYKDLMKRAYSYTPDEEEYAQKQGYSFNPDSQNYFARVYGDIYNSSVASAENAYGYNSELSKQVYASAIDTAKIGYNRDAEAYKQDYQDTAIANNSAMQQAASAYGSNQSQLASLGLTGSGYNAQIMQSVYGGYQDANSEAYKALQANKQLMSQVYGDKEASAYGTKVASDRADQATLQGAYIDAAGSFNANAAAGYQEIKSGYTAKQQEYTTNAKQIASYIDRGEVDAAYLQDRYNNDFITEDVYKSELARYQTKKAETLTAAVTGATDEASSNAAWSALDTAFSSGDVSLETYNKIYADDYMSTISGLAANSEYDKTLAQLELDKNKLGTSYDTVKSALEAKKAELDKAVAKAKAEQEAKAIAENVNKPALQQGEQVVEGKKYQAQLINVSNREALYYAAERARKASSLDYTEFDFNGKKYSTNKAGKIYALT